MLSVLKTCFLIELICLSFCEASRIKRVIPVVLPPISNPLGSNSLSPLINITLVIGKLQTTCCTSCNPQPTHEPCETCPPPTTCKSCEICPTVTTCEPCTTPSPTTTCEPCTTPTPVITCEPCSTPPPITCKPCETCPTPTTSESSATPSSTEGPCIEARGLPCPEGNWCIIPIRFDGFQYENAKTHCLSNSGTLSFGIAQHYMLKEDKMSCIRKAFIAAEFTNQKPIWNLGDGVTCTYTFFKVENGTIAGVDQLYPANCSERKSFYCVADL